MSSHFNSDLHMNGRENTIKKTINPPSISHRYLNPAPLTGTGSRSSKTTFTSPPMTVSGRSAVNHYSRYSLGRRIVSPNVSDNIKRSSQSVDPQRKRKGEVKSVAKFSSHPWGGVAQQAAGPMTVKGGRAVAQPTSSSLNKHYTIKPVIPAQRAELLSVARAMHRNEFAPRLKKLFDPEREAALEAINSGNYVGWRCPEYDYDCIRVGSNSKCFCGHLLSHHTKATKFSDRGCAMNLCTCITFAFIPARPEDIGEWWLPKRPGFDGSKWRAKCRCKHTHEQHKASGRRQCTFRGCTCFSFESNFLCAACNRHWEDHQTFFETTDARKAQGLPFGEEYLPFHEMPDLRNIVLTGEEDDSGPYEAIAYGPAAIPRNQPTLLARQLQDKR